MNTKLFKALKDKCSKDMGLSDSSLQEIANLHGDGLTDQTTDEEFDKIVNLCVSSAKVAQGEATRWAQKKQTEIDALTKKSKKKDDDDEPGDKGGQNDKNIPEHLQEWKKGVEKQILDLTTENKTLKQSQTSAKRSADIEALIKASGIPAIHAKRLKFSDETSLEDVTKELTEYKQELITDKLMPEDSAEALITQEAAVKAAGESLFEQFAVKD